MTDTAKTHNVPTEVKPNRLQALIETEPVQRRFTSMLGKRAPAFISSIISAVNTTPALRDCEPMSVISAGAIAASLDLPINPSLGFAHIVPYGNQAQFQIGWKGFIQLAQRTGQYRTLHMTVVKEGQIKRIDPFTGEMEFTEQATSDTVVGYLLFFRLLNGFEKYFYMSKAQCEAHGKRYSASYKKNFGQWKDNFDAMALKTVVKLGLSKYGILSIEMQQAMETDQAAIDEEGKATYIDQAPIEVTEAKEAEVVDPNRPGRLAEAVGVKKTEAPAAPAEPAATLL